MQFYAFFGLHSLEIRKRVCYQELLILSNMFYGYTLYNRFI